MSALLIARLRCGLFLLPLAGLLFAIGFVLRGPSVDASNAHAFAIWATTTTFVPGWVALMLGSAFDVLGFVVLYIFFLPTRLETLALWALLLGFFGKVLGLAYQGLAVFALPVLGTLSLQGYINGVQVINALFTDTNPLTLALAISATLMGTLGPLLFGIALWRTGTLPKWAAILYGAHTIFLNFGGSFSFWLEFLGAILLLIGGLAIAVKAQRHLLFDIQEKNTEHSLETLKTVM